MRQELLLPGNIVNRIMTLTEFNEEIQLNESLQRTFPIYRTISAAMESKYSWLGRQVAEELLDSIACSVINRCYPVSFRANQHVLLIWDSGWFKSSLLTDFMSMIPNDYVGGIGKITDAAFRGTIEANAKPGRRFVAPHCLLYDFLIVKEFGRGLTEDAQLKETLLTALEDQRVTVNLAKFSQLDDLERRGIEQQFNRDNLTWENDNLFHYRTAFTMWAANYLPVEDQALLSRFNVVVPNRELDDELRNHVMMHPQLIVELEPGICPPFTDIREAVDAVMATHRPPLPIGFNLSEELRGIRGLTPRIHSSIIKKLLAAAWWGFWYDPDAIRGMALSAISAKRVSQRDYTDAVVDKFKSGFFTLQQVSEELGISPHAVWKVLYMLRDQPFKILKRKNPRDERQAYIHIVDNTSGATSTNATSATNPEKPTKP